MLNSPHAVLAESLGDSSLVVSTRARAGAQLARMTQRAVERPSVGDIAFAFPQAGSGRRYILERSDDRTWIGVIEANVLSAWRRRRASVNRVDPVSAYWVALLTHGASFEGVSAYHFPDEVTLYRDGKQIGLCKLRYARRAEREW